MSSYPIPSPSTYDPEYAASNTPLLHQPHITSSPSGERRRIKVFSGIFIATILFVSLVLLIINQLHEPLGRTVDDDGDKQSMATPEMFRVRSGGNGAYPWTNSMLSWQRTSYHFQPEKNWMNDPNVNRRVNLVNTEFQRSITGEEDFFGKFTISDQEIAKTIHQHSPFQKHLSGEAAPVSHLHQQLMNHRLHGPPTTPARSSTRRTATSGDFEPQILICCSDYSSGSSRNGSSDLQQQNHEPPIPTSPENESCDESRKTIKRRLCEITEIPFQNDVK